MQPAIKSGFNLTVLAAFGLRCWISFFEDFNFAVSFKF